MVINAPKEWPYQIQRFLWLVEVDPVARTCDCHDVVLSVIRENFLVLFEVVLSRVSSDYV